MTKYLFLFVVLGLFSCASNSPKLSNEIKIRDDYVLTTYQKANEISLSWNLAAGKDLFYSVYFSEGESTNDPLEILTQWTPVHDFEAELQSLSITLPETDKVYQVAVLVKDQFNGYASYRTKEIPSHEGIVYNQQIPLESQTTALSPDWWRTAVFYELFVRSFQDSDGDGHGDIRGMINRLDYLAELGIGGIWLMPIMEASDNDHGYAVTDYSQVESTYGSMEDFQEFLDEAHARGIGVIIDFVVNHTSNTHPFFKDSASSNRSDYRHWYIWEREYPGRFKVPDCNQDAFIPAASGYYFAGFWETMPDLNYRNPSVKNYMYDHFRLWLNLGIDGYRFDAVHHLIENGKNKPLDQPESFEIFQGFRDILNSYDNKFLVCENSAPQYLGSDQFNSGFAFGINHYILNEIQQRNASNLASSIQGFASQIKNDAMYSWILSNHDWFAGQRPFRTFGGDEKKVKAAASILLTAPGIPFIYYGEEIGMTSERDSERDYSLRTPMQWDTTSNAGFTTETPYRKLNSNWATYNLELEREDEASIFNHYKKLISIRNANPGLALADFKYLYNTRNRDVYSVIRRYGDETYIVLVNLAEEPSSCSIKVQGASFADLLTGDEFRNENGVIELEVLGTRILKSLQEG
jgi:alpha-amylase